MNCEPKTRQEKGKGKGRKYKDMYSRKHIDAMIDKTTNSLKKNKNNQGKEIKNGK